jgi:hypothetical protein
MSTKPQSDDICFDGAPVVPSNWTDEDEAEYQRYLDDQEHKHEERIRESYALRGLANVY